MDVSGPPGRKHPTPVGIGILGRAGWAPKDRNVIDQFYSFGIAGFGMLIPGRDNDQWGLGWAGTHISSDLGDDVGLFGVDLDCMSTPLRPSDSARRTNRVKRKGEDSYD